MDNYYIKLKNGKYQKMGIFLPNVYLPMGVYYIRDNAKKITSVEWHKINENEILDVLKAVDSIELTEIIINVLDKELTKNQSMYDISKAIAKEILSRK